MGFPQKRPLDKDAFFSGRGGDYVCPRCKSRVEVNSIFHLTCWRENKNNSFFRFHFSPELTETNACFWSQELPSQCTVCKLTLVSSAHLARSYHHLFPVPPFTVRIKKCLSGFKRGTKLIIFSSWTQEGFGLDDEGKRHTSCFACYVDFEEGNESTSNENAPSVCPKCKKTFCFVCDVYIHEKLHNCPGCELVKFLAEEGQWYTSSEKLEERAIK